MNQGKIAQLKVMKYEKKYDLLMERYIKAFDNYYTSIQEIKKIIEAFETPGEHVFHNEAAPTIFGKSGIKGVMKDIWNRVGFGGDAPPVSQRECGSFLYPFQAEQSDASRVPLGSATGVFLVIRKTNSCV